MTALTELLARVETATGADRELDDALAVVFGWQKTEIGWRDPNSVLRSDRPRFSHSIDAVLAALKRMLPGWGGEISFGQPPWAIVTSPDYEESEDFVEEKGFMFMSGAYGKPPAATPALALNAALLKAKITQAASPASGPSLALDDPLPKQQGDER